MKEVFLNNWDKSIIIDAHNNKTYSYCDFVREIIRFNVKLNSIGLNKNDKVVLILTNSINMAVLIFASWVKGLVVITVDPSKGDSEISEVLNGITYDLLVSDIDKYNGLDNFIDISEFSNFVNGKSTSCGSIEAGVFEQIDYESLALITFTSGTSGVSKGVMHSINNLIMAAVSFNDYFKFDNRNIFLHNLPMSYMAGILNLMIVPLIAGSQIVVVDRFSVSNVNKFWDDVIKYSVNTFWFTPTILSMLLKLDRGTIGSDYTRKHQIIGCVGTAPLNQQTKQRFEQKYGIPLFESYGLSETLFVSTNHPDITDKETTGVGELLYGVELDFHKDGEILIDVPWCFLGYTNEQGEAKSCNISIFSSGDYGELDSKGRLWITGRKKDLIIRGGINISPKRIEDLITESGIFDEFAIVGNEDAILGEKIVCVYVKRDEFYSENARKDLARKVVNELGKDYTIDQYTELKNIPKNTNGKIDKKAIRELLSSEK